MDLDDRLWRVALESPPGGSGKGRVVVGVHAEEDSRALVARAINGVGVADAEVAKRKDQPLAYAKARLEHSTMRYRPRPARSTQDDVASKHEHHHREHAGEHQEEDCIEHVHVPLLTLLTERTRQANKDLLRCDRHSA